MAGEIVLSTPVANGTTIALAWTYFGCGVGVSSFDVKRKVSGGAYATLDTVAVPTDEYVDSTAAYDITYTYQIVCNEGHASNAPSRTMWSGTFTDTDSWSDSFEGTVGETHSHYYQTFTDTLTWGGTGGELVPAADTFTEIVVWGDWCSGSQALESDFVYYYADTASNVYSYDTVFKGDNDEIIPCSWRSKKLDFADQYPQYANFRKTVYRVIVTYVDKDQISLGVSISADGSSSWTSSVKTVGTGSGVTKRAYYHFIEGATGQFFNLELTHGSKDKTFQILGMDVEWAARAGAFEI